ncbi:MAG: signal peptidase II [Clostridia bacterium]|nr:signal peptidase II [Clostridia bacterium]
MPYIIAIVFILLDQLSKYLYVDVFGMPTVSVIDGVLELTYVENRGAAWGLFADRQILLYIFSAVITIAIIVFFILKYRKMGKLMRYSLALIIAGAVGNMIDRFAFGYVRDMINFAFIEFPVFNVADMCITVGAVLVLIAVIVFEKDTPAPVSSETDGKSSVDANIESQDSLPDDSESTPYEQSGDAK